MPRDRVMSRPVGLNRVSAVHDGA